jgi:putative endonuclease
MYFYVYILYSAQADKYYIGSSQDLQDRIYRHTNSGSKFTKFVHDWKLVYSETFEARSQAIKRETGIKRKKSRKYIEWLISSTVQSVPMVIGKVTPA